MKSWRDGPPLFHVSRIEARLIAYDWNWAETCRSDILIHWNNRKAKQPALFNGRILLLAEAHREGDVLQAGFFEADYAHLLALKDMGFPDPAVANGFAMGALRSSDGFWCLGVMGAHTANAGQIYFPAGTPDLEDVSADGLIDLQGNIRREIAEETGLSDTDYELEPDWTIVVEEGQVVFFNKGRLKQAARVVQERIRAFLASSREPELFDILMVKDRSTINTIEIRSFVRKYLDKRDCKLRNPYPEALEG